MSNQTINGFQGSHPFITDEHFNNLFLDELRNIVEEEKEGLKKDYKEIEERIKLINQYKKIKEIREKVNQKFNGFQDSITFITYKQFMNLSLNEIRNILKEERKEFNKDYKEKEEKIKLIDKYKKIKKCRKNVRQR